MYEIHKTFFLFNWDDFCFGVCDVFEWSEEENNVAFLVLNRHNVQKTPEHTTCISDRKTLLEIKHYNVFPMSAVTQPDPCSLNELNT